MTSIVLVTGSVAFEDRVRRAMSGRVNGDLQRWRDELLLADPLATVRTLADSSPDVVALGPGMESSQALELAWTFEQERPEVTVVIVAPPSPEMWANAMRAGARDLLAPDAPEAEMHEVFARALDSSRRMRENLVGSIEIGTPTGRVITVTAPKGGSGKTAVASNLAVTLARHAPGQVVLVDLDLQFGDQAHALLLSPEHTMSDVVRWDRLDIITLKAFLTPRHDDLFVLAAPESPAAGELIDPDRVAHVLDLLAHEFPFVVIDTPAGLTEHTLTAIERSSDLVLICDMDVASVRGLRKLREALDQLGMSQQQRHYLLNRSDSRVGIDIDDAAATIGNHFDIKMPSARTVPMSMNQGTPFVESAPRSGVARAIDDLAGRFIDRGEERSGGFLRRRASA